MIIFMFFHRSNKIDSDSDSDSDLDACALGFHDCHEKADCVMKARSFSCVCREGWRGVGRPGVWASGRECYGECRTRERVHQLSVRLAIALKDIQNTSDKNRQHRLIKLERR